MTHAQKQADLERPTWPHGDIVKMYAHRSGQWARKVGGKTQYFGAWSDPDEALAMHVRIAANSQTEKSPATPKSTATKPQQGKPAWPHGSIVKMYAHGSGQWAKRIRGKVQYFGPWNKPDEAMALYRDIGDDLHAGREPLIHMVARGSGGVTLDDLSLKFLEWKQDQVTTGELKSHTYRGYFNRLRFACEALGRKVAVADLRPADFQRLRTKVMGQYSASASGTIFTITRMMFTWGFDEGVIESPPRMGKYLRKPQKRLYRESYDSKEPYSVIEIKKLIMHASPQVYAMLLLGLNMGYGNTDVGMLPKACVHLAESRIQYRRPKTGVQRAGILWPETVEALAAVRPPKDWPLWFRTRFGNPWVVHHEMGSTDSVGLMFGKLCKEVGIKKPHSFYRLRHTFCTAADELELNHATKRIMGQSLPGLADVYVHRVESGRLQRVADHVREALSIPELVAARQTSNG